MNKLVDPCMRCPSYQEDYHLGYEEGNYKRDCRISECVRKEVQLTQLSTLRAVIADLRKRVTVLQMSLPRAEGAEVFSIHEKVAELDEIADTYESQLQ